MLRRLSTPNLLTRLLTDDPLLTVIHRYGLSAAAPTSILQNPTSKVLSWYSLVLAETAFAELGDPSRSDGDPHLADSDLKRYAPVMW